jgi:hypothetical protein
MSDLVDEHLDRAFASLDEVPVRELVATSEALERRKDGLRNFVSIFRQVAQAREEAGARIFPASTYGRNLSCGRRAHRPDRGCAGTVLKACARDAGRPASVTPRRLGAAARTNPSSVATLLRPRRPSHRAR